MQGEQRKGIGMNGKNLQLQSTRQKANYNSKQLKLAPKIIVKRKEQLPLTAKQKLGRVGEMFVNYLSSTVLKYAYDIRHNDFNNYAKNQGRDCDIKVSQNKDVIFGFEVKDWRLLPNQYGIEFVKTEILPVSKA